MVDRIRVNLPAGRMVQGDLYHANDTDFVTKQKRVYPAGHRLAGQPKITYFFAVAIKKNGEQHWAQTQWGGQIYQFAQQAWPVDPRTGVSAIQRPDFAWKVEDGDSTVPNKNNRINARTEGFAGCWVVSCSSTYPPKIITTDFTPITEPNAVKRGFWVEVVATVDTNESQGNPGIYINGEFVMFRGIDKEISGAVDPRSIQGFGQSALPAGITAVGGPPAPAGAMPIPSFPMSGMPLAGAGFGGVPNVPQLPAPGHAPFMPTPNTGVSSAPTIPGMASAAFPSSPPPTAAQQPLMPPGVTSVPGFLPNAAPPGFPSAPQAGPVPFASPGAAGPTPSPNAPAPGYPPYGAMPAAPGLPPPAPSGAAPGSPVLTAKCPPGLTWAAMQAQGWTVDAARAQGYVQ